MDKNTECHFRSICDHLSTKWKTDCPSTLFPSYATWKQYKRYQCSLVLLISTQVYILRQHGRRTSSPHQSYEATTRRSRGCVGLAKRGPPWQIYPVCALLLGLSATIAAQLSYHNPTCCFLLLAEHRKPPPQDLEKCERERGWVLPEGAQHKS